LSRPAVTFFGVPLGRELSEWASNWAGARFENAQRPACGQQLQRRSELARPLLVASLALRSTPTSRQAGFTLIEMMMVVVILGVLAAVAVGAYTRQVRNAHKTEVIADLSGLTLRQKTFLGKSGHYASTTDCEGDTCVYPLMATLIAAKGPVRWDTSDAAYTLAGQADAAYFRGGGAVHGFDALQWVPENGDSWCGYATISGHGSASQNNDADTPPTGTPIVDQEFPAAVAAPYVARDWFVSYALCDFDFDGIYWAFSTTHASNTVNYTTDDSGLYQENE
jgi:prepilin-type N-terminal cleavage/methylation domain-containing protein